MEDIILILQVPDVNKMPQPFLVNNKRAMVVSNLSPWYSNCHHTLICRISSSSVGGKYWILWMSFRHDCAMWCQTLKPPLYAKWETKLHNGEGAHLPCGEGLTWLIRKITCKFELPGTRAYTTHLPSNACIASPGDVKLSPPLFCGKHTIIPTNPSPCRILRFLTTKNSIVMLWYQPTLSLSQPNLRWTIKGRT